MNTETETESRRALALEGLPEDQKSALLELAADQRIGPDDPMWALVQVASLNAQFYNQTQTHIKAQIESLRRISERKERELEATGEIAAEALHKPIEQITPPLSEAVERLSAAAQTMAKTAASQTGGRLSNKQADQMIKAAARAAARGVDRKASAVLARAGTYLAGAGAVIFILGVALGAAVIKGGGL